MTTLLKIIASGLVGIMLGLLVTIGSLNPERHGIAAGPWRGSPRDGTPDIDPYALAAIARSGLLPLGAAEGVSFVATTDGAGASLSPRCDYVVRGPMPAARFWTLSVLTPDGFPIANPAERYGFTSAEVLLQNQDPIVVTVSARARSGNWLPVGAASGFVLMLRLYDTSLSASGTTFGAASLPSIQKGTCG